jgi:hypothetical protein
MKMYKDDMEAEVMDTQIEDMVEAGWSIAKGSEVEAPVVEELAAEVPPTVEEPVADAPAPTVSKRKIK